MRKSVADAIIDLGHAKVAVTVPREANREQNSVAGNYVNSQIFCKAMAFENLHIDLQTAPTSKQEIQRGEALRRIRIRAEQKAQQKVRRVLLLAAESSLQAISHSDQDYRKNGLRRLNAIVVDHNKRPLAFYAMEEKKWQAYNRIADYAGVKIIGFVFPTIAMGYCLLTQMPKHKNANSFIVLDIGAHKVSIALFEDGLPYGMYQKIPHESLNRTHNKTSSAINDKAVRAFSTIDFGTRKLNNALADTLQITSKNAEQLLHSMRFSEETIASYLGIEREKHKEKYSKVIEIKRHFPQRIASSLQNTMLSQHLGKQGVEQIITPIYSIAMQEVASQINRIAPRFPKDAPVYMYGGGANIPGAQTLATNILQRCVFPAILPRIEGISDRRHTESISAIAALFLLASQSRQNNAYENKNHNAHEYSTKQFKLSQTTIAKNEILATN